MKGIREKFRYIFIPYLLIAIGFTTVYSFLNWLFFVQFHFIHLKEDLVNIWLPFGLAWIPILIWIRPKFMFLNFKNENASFAIQFIISLAIAIPTMIIQDYLLKSTGKLTKIENLSNYSSNDATKYYQVSKLFIDTQRVVFRSTATSSGKYNQNLTFHIYALIPLMDKKNTPPKGETRFFIGKEYTNTISNRLSDTEKDLRYRNFANKTENEFRRTNFQTYNYLERLGNTDDLDEYNKMVSESVFSDTKKRIIFIARMEKFEARVGDNLLWAGGVFSGVSLIVFILLLFPSFDESEFRNFKKGQKKTDYSLHEALNLIVPRENYFVTPLLININLFVFIIMVFAGYGVMSFKADDLLKLGANYEPYVKDGEWWRLITCMFLHGNIGHIIGNTIGLFLAGIFLEPLFKRWQYVAVYIITGMLASLTSIWWNDTSISVGASGAIFGLYGLILAVTIFRKFEKKIESGGLVFASIYIAFSLLMGLAGAGIDWAAHIGGLISGFVIGALISLFGKNDNQ